MAAEPNENQSVGEQREGEIHIVDPMLRQGFAQLPRLVLRAEGLSDKAKIVYALLLDYAWQQGSCFPGQQRLARDLSTTERTIRRALDELKRFKLIDWKRRGLSQTNIYYILSLPAAFVSASTETERTKLSDQERSRASDQNRTPVSDNVDPERLDSDLYPRISNGTASERTGKGTTAQKNPDPPQSVQQWVTPYHSASPPRRSSLGFTPIGRTLQETRVLPVNQPLDRESQPVSPELVACIADVAQEFGDSRHLRSNLTQARHLLQLAGIPESLLVMRLYEARAITKDRRRSVISSQGRSVAKPMAYFWIVVRDLLGLRDSNAEATTASDAVYGALGRGGGEEWTNGQREG